MLQTEVDMILAQLTGERDPHVLAHAYDSHRNYPSHPASVAKINGRRLALFLRLNLVERRPGHEDLPDDKADHILSDRGMAFGKAVCRQFNLAMASPPL